jgi:hypothetical protein
MEQLMMTRSERQQVERILLLLSVGICDALEEGAIETAEAEHLLFSPAVMRVLEEMSFDPSVIDVIHAGTEVEDIESLASDTLQSYLREIRGRALQQIRDFPRYDFQQEKWLVERLRDPNRV